MNLPIALQLYSVRDALAQDFIGTVKQVAAWGYDGIEVFGSFVPAKEVHQLAVALGVKVCGRHTVFDALVANLQGEIETTLETGSPYLVCAWSKNSEQWNWQQIADKLEEIGSVAHQHGLKFAYHNHAHEILESHNNQRVMDLILSKPHVLGELDIAWVRAGGVNPQDYLKTFAAKSPLLHIKDVAFDDKDWQTVELGHGQVELAKAIEAARAEWLIVEQDHSPDPMGSAKRNLETLRAMVGR